MTTELAVDDSITGTVLSPRVLRIIEHERLGDEHQAKSDEHRWQAAELIAAELADGKSQRQLGREIHKDHKDVAWKAKCWELWGPRSPLDRPAWNEAYHSPEVRGLGSSSASSGGTSGRRASDDDDDDKVYDGDFTDDMPGSDLAPYSEPPFSPPLPGPLPARFDAPRTLASISQLAANLALWDGEPLHPALATGLLNIRNKISELLEGVA